MSLPVESLREPFFQRFGQAPLVIQSPTGSGKSSLVPLWCLEHGTVLVVEPRRVAARAVARHAAELLAEPLGGRVGYATRGDSRHGEATQLLFVTPGVALALLGNGEFNHYTTWILDEFHERRAETDMLLAIARQRHELNRTVLLSATLDTGRLEEEYGFECLRSHGREYPVDIEYACDRGQQLPEEKGLAQRLERAVIRLEQPNGTVLAFLPGVSEINEAAAWCAGRHDWEVLPLHGGLSPEAQDRVFTEAPTGRLRLVLATNVAESAITVPGVSAVIDSGLERRIEHDGPLPTLVLGAISQASATQRAGRAGRTSAGRALRLWNRNVKLRADSPPRILIDSPSGWLLPALAAGINPLELPWLNRPLASDLRRTLELFEEAGLIVSDPWTVSIRFQLTSSGRRVLNYPLDPLLGALCARLEKSPARRDALALAAALSGRPLPLSRPDPEQMAARANMGSCDAACLAAAPRASLETIRAAGLSIGAWREAKETFERLMDRMRCPEQGWPLSPQSESLALEFARIFPSQLHLRQNLSKVSWAAHGGRSLLLSRGSLESQRPPPEILLAIATHGSRRADGRTIHYAESAHGFSRATALREGLGRLSVEEAWEENGQVMVKVNHLIAGTVIGTSTRPADTPFLWAHGCAALLPEDAISLWQTSISRLWLEICARQGHWSAPPESAREFIARALLRDEEAQKIMPRRPLHLPLPPGADESVIATAFPEHFEGSGWSALVHPDVRHGRIRLEVTSGSLSGSFRKELPACWKGWTIAR